MPIDNKTALAARSKFSKPILLFFCVVFAAIGIRLLFHSKADVPLTPTINVCGARQASDVEQYTGPALPNPSYVNEISPGGTTGITNFQYWPGASGQNARWYILQLSGQQNGAVYVYDATNDSLITSFSLPAITSANYIHALVVDPGSGDVIIGQATTNGQQGILQRFTTAGSQVWLAHTTDHLTGSIYGYTDSSSVFRIGAVVDVPGQSGQVLSNTFDANGNPLANNNVIGSNINVATLHNNDIVATNGKYIRIYDSTGMTQKFYLGSELTGTATGPWHFSTLNGATEEADGTIVAADIGLMFFDPNGTYLGSANQDPFVKSTNIDIVSAGTNLLIVNGRFYYSAEHPFSAPNKLTYVTQANAHLLYQYPPGAPYHLGIGAGAYTNQTDNYFPSGTTPQVYLQFNKWWEAQAANFTGTYNIRSLEQIKAGESGTPTSFSIPSTDLSYTNNVANTAVSLPSTQPGQYEMDMHLLKNGQSVGADCLYYTIGEPSSGFNPAAMSGLGTDTAAVELAHQFGQKLYRSVYGLPTCYPGVTTPTISTVPACPASMLNDATAAAALASQYGMTYEIQLGAAGSGPYLSAGTAIFQNLVQQMAAAVPAAKNWECWNEPDTNTFSSGTDYITRALVPCYQGIKAASASNTVIGGSFSSMGPTSSWWNQFTSGGLSYVDVIALHTYTGHNRSFEEEGYIIPTIYAANGETGIIQQFQTKFSTGGFHGPIWDTEQGFWVDGPYNAYTQGDRLVRKQILERSIGINNAYNFQNNADYGISGVTFTLFHKGSLTSGGTASIVYGDQLYNRQFLTWLPTSTPHTYAAEFGPSASDSGDVVAIWSDDVTVGMVPTIDNGIINITDEYGRAGSVASGSSFNVSGSVQYLAIPAGKTISLSPAESFGGNLAGAAAGASAASSSSYACSGFSLTPDRAIDGVLDTQGKGNICDSPNGMNLWVGGASDNDPTMTIALASPQSIDRLYVSSQGLGSVEVGLRDYTISFDNGNGTFANPINISNQYLARDQLIKLPSALSVSKIKVSNIDINYSGDGNGLPPAFWNSGFAGQPTVYEIEAYAPGSQQTQSSKPGDINNDGMVNSSDLTLLLANFGTSYPAADINKNGTVDAGDFSVVLSNFGK